MYKKIKSLFVLEPTRNQIVTVATSQGPTVLAINIISPLLIAYVLYGLLHNNIVLIWLFVQL